MTKRILLSIFLFSLSGCSSSTEEPTTSSSGCDARAKVSGVCPGFVSNAATTLSTACSKTIDVAAPADLDGKLAGATAGTCVKLPAGAFGAIVLPPGVSLLGKDPASTTVASVKVTGHAVAATIAGLKISGGSISAEGKGLLVIDNVHVTGAGKSPGISAVDTNLEVHATTIEKGAGIGLAAACKTDCATARPTLLLRRVLVSENKIVGVWAHGVIATLDGVQIASTKADNFLYGRGIEVAEGGELRATHLAALNNDDVGIYVDSAVASIVGFTASGNVRGVQLQAIPAGGAKLDDFAVENNAALGIGITKGSLGIIVQGGLVASTKAMKVPVDIGGVQEVGDGINWLGGSEVNILSSVKIQASARRAVIIEATSKGKFEGVLSGGDEATGIIVQGGLEPSMPASLSVAAGVKSEVLTKDKAMPVAVSMAASKAP